MRFLGLAKDQGRVVDNNLLDARVMGSVATRPALAPKEHSFATALDAVRGIRRHKEHLDRTAREQGRIQIDQGHPVEFFALRPALTTSTPLVLLGGMGPLAGVEGFEAACRRFKDLREIVLFQACSMPDRTSVLKNLPTVNGLPSISDCSSPDYADIVHKLECAIAEALTHVRASDGFIDLIVLCNTCHFFLPAALNRLADYHPGIASRLRITSLIKSAIQATRRRRFKRVLGLYTEGTKLSKIYSQVLNRGSFSHCVERTDLQPVLSDSIYYGVKAFDEEAIIRLGSAIFHEILKDSNEFDCILAGCTEVPLIVDRLKAKGNKRITEFLTKVEIIDPVAEALALV